MEIHQLHYNRLIQNKQTNLMECTENNSEHDNTNETKENEERREKYNHNNHNDDNDDNDDHGHDEEDDGNDDDDDDENEEMYEDSEEEDQKNPVPIFTVSFNVIRNLINDFYNEEIGSLYSTDQSGFDGRRDDS